MILLMPLMLLLSGCFDDSILDAIKSEKDFIAPYTVVEERPNRTVYFEISDSRRTGSVIPGDDASYVDVPNKIDLVVHDNYVHDVYGATGHNVVVDNVSGLMWTKCAAKNVSEIDSSADCSAPPHSFEWIEAADIYEKNGICDQLDYAGFNDWRMPTASELFSIMNFDNTCTLDSLFFPYNYEPDAGVGRCQSSIFWAFTSKYIPYELYSIAAYFDSSAYFFALNFETRDKKRFIRCVRNNI